MLTAIIRTTPARENHLHATFRFILIISADILRVTRGLRQRRASCVPRYGTESAGGSAPDWEVAPTRRHTGFGLVTLPAFIFAASGWK